MRADDIGDEFAPALRSSVAGEEVDGDVVLYDEATRTVHVLNGTAAVIATSFDGVATVADIAAELADIYGAPLDEVREGVFEVARRLATEWLVEGVDGDAPPPEPAPGATGESWLVDPPSR